MWVVGERGPRTWEPSSSCATSMAAESTAALGKERAWPYAAYRLEFHLGQGSGFRV